MLTAKLTVEPRENQRKRETLVDKMVQIKKRQIAQQDISPKLSKQLLSYYNIKSRKMLAFTSTCG
jgi:hypothetical protein